MPEDGHEETSRKLLSMQKHASSAIVFFPVFAVAEGLNWAWVFYFFCHLFDWETLLY